MVNKCAAFGCKSGYVTKKSNSETEKVSLSTFGFPLDKPELLAKWTQFVNRANWTPTRYSVLCIKHFKDEYMNK